MGLSRYSGWGRFLRRRPRILCYLVHYFGPNPGFVGKSTSSAADQRSYHVRRVIERLQSERGLELKVCGMGGRALVSPDIDFGGLERPEYLVYESLDRMAGQLESYDYFLVVEDDVLVPGQVLRNIAEFDKAHTIEECLHPNRLERQAGQVDCVDLRSMPGWTDRRMWFKGVELRVALNPHSAFLMLSQEKFDYALARTDRSYRGRFLGGYMSSGFAHYHRPFQLYRPYTDLDFHSVLHLDHWMGLDPADAAR